MSPNVAQVVPRPRAPTVSRTRRNVALVLAILADAIQWVFFPVTIEGALSPVEIGIDVGTALVLLIVLGFRWQLLLAFALELVPGLDMFPTWAAVVLSMKAEPEPSRVPLPAPVVPVPTQPSSARRHR